VLDAIKFEHTIFALPFAYIAMVLAARGWPGWWTVGWVTAAMVGGRTCAMAANRVIDRFIPQDSPLATTVSNSPNYRVKKYLPKILNFRRQNRGFEGLAIHQTKRRFSSRCRVRLNTRPGPLAARHE